MSSALSLIVLGQAYFLYPVGEVLPTSTPTGTSIPNVQQIRRDDYNYTSGIGAHKLFTEFKTWNEARRACKEDGGHLLIINSLTESRVINQLLKQAEIPNAWVGIHDHFKENEHVTIHDESLAEAGFNEWLGGEPDNEYGHEHCVKVESTSTIGKYGDAPCERSKNYICELSRTQARPLERQSSPVSFDLVNLINA